MLTYLNHKHIALELVKIEVERQGRFQEKNALQYGGVARVI